MDRAGGRGTGRESGGHAAVEKLGVFYIRGVVVDYECHGVHINDCFSASRRRDDITHGREGRVVRFTKKGKCSVGVMVSAMATVSHHRGLTELSTTILAAHAQHDLFHAFERDESPCAGERGAKSRGALSDPLRQKDWVWNATNRCLRCANAT
jgi:hypothetical protein